MELAGGLRDRHAKMRRNKRGDEKACLEKAWRRQMMMMMLMLMLLMAMMRGSEEVYREVTLLYLALT